MQVDVFSDADAQRFIALIRMAENEIAALTAALPAAIDAQWSGARRRLPREDTTERASGRIADPTGDAATCDKRHLVRMQVVRSERALRSKIIALRGARLALESAVGVWDGEESP